MTDYQKKLAEEHSELVLNITKLSHYINTGQAILNDDKVEFANKLVQLNAMNMYKQALEARMTSAGLFEEEGNYFVKVGENRSLFELDYPIPEKGNDYDLDENSSPVEESDDSK